MIARELCLGMRTLEDLVNAFGEPMKRHIGRKNREEYYIYSEETLSSNFNVVAIRATEENPEIVATHFAYRDEELEEELRMLSSEKIISNSPVYFTDIRTEEKERGQGLASAIFSPVISFLEKEEALHITRFTRDGQSFIMPKYERLNYKTLELALPPKGQESYLRWLWFNYGNSLNSPIII